MQEREATKGIFVQDKRPFPGESHGVTLFEVYIKD